MRKITVLGAALQLLLAAAAWAGGTGGGGTYWLISHGGDNPFWNVVRKGAQDAALELGCTVQFYMSDGNLKAQLGAFDRAVGARPDGIAVSITDDKAWDQPVRRALAAGVPVIGINNDDSQGAAGNSRLCYIGQNDEHAAYMLALRLIEAAQRKGYDIFDTETVVFSELPSGNFNIKRAAGVRRALGEFGMKEPRVVDLSSARGRYDAVIESHLDAGGGRMIAITLGGVVTDFLYPAVKATGRSPGEIIAGGFDMAPQTIEGIRAGYIAATVDQQQYLQGYFAVYVLNLHRKYGFVADIDTGGSIIDSPSQLETIARLSPLLIR